MKILMVNRANAYTQFGGDTMQMLETKMGLEKLGINVEVKLGEQDIDEYKKFDIIHFFNIQTDDFTLAEIIKAKKVGKPVAVSTIWWNYSDIESNADEKYLSSRAKKFKKILGERLFLKIQRFKRLNEQKTKVKNRKKILEYADILLPNSNIEQQMLDVDFSGDYSKKSLVVYNGISKKKLDIESKIGKEVQGYDIQEKKFALQVGRVESLKNNLYTIKACNELKIPLIFIGEAVDVEYLDKCRSEAEGSKVYFLGKKDIEEIVAFYRNAKVHILPSYRETPGLASLEAAYCGCNIVSTSVGSAKEYFGELAYYCDPLNYESIKCAIQKAWNSPNDDELSKLISNKFTWDEAARKTLEAYNKIKS